MKVQGFIQCPGCKKLHQMAGIDRRTVCPEPCGVMLWPLVMAVAESVIAKRGENIGQ